MRQKSMLLVALLVVALAAGCAKKPDDAALVTNIQSQMFADQLLKNANLQVTSNNGEVALTGTVPSAEAHLDAYKIASQTPGVTKVNDQITVQEAQAAPPPEPAPAPAETPSHSRKAHVKKHHPAEEEAQFANNAPPPPADTTPAEMPPPPQPTPACSP